MRSLWKKVPADQLDLLDAKVDDGVPAATASEVAPTTEQPPSEALTSATTESVVAAGLPLVVPIASIDEDPGNPRTEVPDDELGELADDIRQHGILQPIVVHPASVQGRYRIHFGAKRWRAAQRAGLADVPIVVRDALADPYAQVAENRAAASLQHLGNDGRQVE